MSKKTFICALLLSLLIFGGIFIFAKSVPLSLNKLFSQRSLKDRDPLDIYRPNLISSQQEKLGSLQNSTRYEINLKIDNSLISFTGNQTVFYTNNEEVPLEKIFFNLIPNTGGDYLHIKNIEVNNSQINGTLGYSNSVLEIGLNTPLIPGETIQVKMDFSGKVPEQMGGNYGLFIYQEDILALDSFFPIIPVYEMDRWQVQDPPRNADLIYTDAAFFKVNVEAPKDLVLVASGSVINKQIINDHQIVTFAGGPQRDFYLAASSKFKEISKIDGEVRISSYYYEDFNKSGELVLETTVKALRVFSKRYGPYPYTEYDLVSTPMRAGGMEYSGAAAMAVGLYGSGSTSNGSPNNDFLEFATAHEAAHQWFFNQVMNDQITEPWLDEGMAQYLTYIYYLDIYGAEAADQILEIFNRYWARSQKQEIPIGMPANDYGADEYSAIIYGKAPLFILELEKKMGEDNFSRFLADYVSEYQWKTVDTQQFRSLAQESCGCDLTGLFDEWWAFN